jgi:hypothetical protein
MKCEVMPYLQVIKSQHADMAFLDLHVSKVKYMYVTWHRSKQKNFKMVSSLPD